MWFQAVVSLSGCYLVVFDLSPTCGLSSCLLDLVSQILAPGLVVVSLSSTSFPDAVSQLSPRGPRCGFWAVVSHSCCCLVSSASLPDRCGLSVVSHMWFPRCCLPVASKVSPCVVLWSQNCPHIDTCDNYWQFRFVSQNWTSNYLHMSSIRCPVVF